MQANLANVLSQGLWDLFYYNWALISMLCTVALLIGIPALVLRKYVKIALNILDNSPPPLLVGPTDFDLIDGRQFTFHSFDGHALSGLLIEGQPARRPRGLIVFAHEYSSDANSFARYCRALLEAGYDVMSFDFRGHGASCHQEGYKPRQWASDREQSDMLGAIAYAEDYLERHGRPKELGLFGISRGGCAAILAAVDLPSVKAIVTDGAFSTDTTIEYFMKRWATIFARVRVVAESHPPSFWRFLRWLLLRAGRRKLGCRFPSVRKALQRLDDRAIFLIHGQRDGFIPVSQSQMLYEVAGGPKYLWIVPGAKHNQSAIVQPEAYGQRLVRFFDEHLAHQTDDPLQPDSLSDLAQPLAEHRPVHKMKRVRTGGRL
ncbi:MAG: alpha/beta hydrolase [Phycisphaerae bacterium]